MEARYWYNLPEQVRCEAIAFSQFWEGASGWGWYRNAALKMLEYCRESLWAVLGGAVYEVSQPFIPAGLWYTDRHSDESWNHYVARSLAEAQRYIIAYTANTRSEALFEVRIQDEKGFLSLTQAELARALAEAEAMISSNMRQLNASLKTLQHLVRLYLSRQITLERLRANLLASLSSVSDAQTRAERLRLDLLYFCVGVVETLSSRSIDQQLLQLLDYLEGREPFVGELLCWKNE